MMKHNKNAIRCKLLPGLLAAGMLISAAAVPGMSVCAETAVETTTEASRTCVDAAGKAWSEDDFDREWHESNFFNYIEEDLKVTLTMGSDITDYTYPLFSVIRSNRTYLLNNEDGRILREVVCLVDGKYMYADDNGEVVSGCWIFTQSGWMYFGWDCYALTSQWICLNHTWYYLNEKGIMETGWLKQNGTWYYLDDSGAMQTGWLKQNGTWYYLDDSGLMAEGWKQVNGTWYYLNRGSGAMQTGWLKDGGSWYYLKDSGAMACDEQMKINGVNYSFDKSGKWIEK